MQGKRVDEIQRYWDKEAVRVGAKVGSHSDPYLVGLENWFIIEKCLKRFHPKRLLDIGCGNGQRTKLLAEHVARTVVGIDSSKNMIKIAKKLENKKMHFYVASILDEESLKVLGEPFDCVVSFRCLINLGSVQNQLKAINHATELLKNGGMFAFCEGSRRGTRDLNVLRGRLGLRPIKPISVNLDLDERTIRRHLEAKFQIVERTTFPTYYLLTRVYYPALISPKEPNPSSKFNSLAARLSIGIENDMSALQGRHLCMVCIKKA
jgi:SAM-dependent methyltransferase